MVAAPAMAMADAPPVDFFDQGEDAPPADAAAGGFVQNLAMDNGVRIAEHPGGDLVLGRAPEPDRDAPDIGIGMAAPAMPPIALRDDAMAGDMPMRAQLGECSCVWVLRSIRRFGSIGIVVCVHSPDANDEGSSKRS